MSTLHLYSQLRDLASHVDPRDIDPHAGQFFLNYLKSPRLEDEAFDCSEIADDFMNALQRGKIYQIVPVGAPDFFVYELGNIEQYVNHYVYVNNNVAYDPRLHTSPIYWIDYQNFIQMLNPNKQFRLV